VYRKKRDNSDQGYLEPIAVIGMACKLPEAEDYLAFWQRLIQGKSSIRRVPASRWNWEGAGELDPKVLPPWCGLTITHNFRVVRLASYVLYV
jgi:hypothetical protein